MNVIVRMYWQHDLDLVALKMHPDFNMGYWMKKAVIAYAKGSELSIPLPSSIPYSVKLDSCCTHFRLTPGKDDEIIAFLNGFRSGFRNSAIKLMFRHYLEGTYIDPFLNDKTFIAKTRVRDKANGTSPAQLGCKEIKVPLRKKKTPTSPTIQTGNEKLSSEQLLKTKDKDSYPSSLKEDNLSVYTSNESDDKTPDTEDTFDIFSAVDNMMGK